MFFKIFLLVLAVSVSEQSNKEGFHINFSDGLRNTATQQDFSTVIDNEDYKKELDAIKQKYEDIVVNRLGKAETGEFDKLWDEKQQEIEKLNDKYKSTSENVPETIPKKVSETILENVTESNRKNVSKAS